MRNVAQAAGINQATLLYHFKDKEALIVALVDELISRLRQRARRSQPGELVPGDPFAGFDAHLESMREALLSAPEVFVAFNEISTRAIRDPSIAAKIQSVEQEWTDYVRSVLEPAIPDRREADAAAQATIVFLRGLSARAASDGTLAGLLAQRPGSRSAWKQLASTVDEFVALMHARARR